RFAFWAERGRPIPDETVLSGSTSGLVVDAGLAFRLAFFGSFLSITRVAVFFFEGLGRLRLTVAEAPAEGRPVAATAPKPRAARIRLSRLLAVPAGIKPPIDGTVSPPWAPKNPPAASTIQAAPAARQ